MLKIQKYVLTLKFHHVEMLHKFYHVEVLTYIIALILTHLKVIFAPLYIV